MCKILNTEESKVLPNYGNSDTKHNRYIPSEDKHFLSQKQIYPYSPQLSSTKKLSSQKHKISKKNFDLIKLLGTGAYSKVVLVHEVNTCKKFAMKIMEKSFLKRVIYK